jgi:hypothetical protein
MAGIPTQSLLTGDHIPVLASALALVLVPVLVPEPELVLERELELVLGSQQPLGSMPIIVPALIAIFSLSPLILLLKFFYLALRISTFHSHPLSLTF